MKSQKLIRKQLEQVYEHRLLLRIERKTKKCFRNCIHGRNKEFDLGDFGTLNKWQCQKGKKCDQCKQFVCLNNTQSIEEEMLNDISDPSICGAKEPKIAMLMWVLHDDKKFSSYQKKRGFFSKMKGLFR